MGEVLLNHGFHGWAGMGRGGPAFVSFVYFVVPSLRGVEAHLMASWRPTPAPGADVPNLLSTGLHLGVCRTTKYTKYTKAGPPGPSVPIHEIRASTTPRPSPFLTAGLKPPHPTTDATDNTDSPSIGRVPPRGGPHAHPPATLVSHQISITPRLNIFKTPCENQPGRFRRHLNQATTITAAWFGRHTLARESKDFLRSRSLT